MLNEVLSDKAKAQNFVKRANPQIKQRLDLFPFKNTDLKRFEVNMGEPRRASVKDPFMSNGSYKHY